MYYAADLSRVVNGPHFEGQTRLEPTFIFEAQFRLESQIYQTSQDVRNCEVSKNVVYGISSGR